jgi:hypothetical protein
VRPLLRAAGDEITPALTGLGERAHLATPDVDLDTHIEDVVGVMEYPEGPPVTAVSILVLAPPSIAIVGPYRGSTPPNKNPLHRRCLALSLCFTVQRRESCYGIQTPADTNSALVVV